MLYPRLGNPRLLRLAIISLSLFFLPAMYIDTHFSTWDARLAAFPIRSSPKEAALLIQGLSLSLPTPSPAVAVCLSQEALTNPFPSAYQSIHQHLIEVLQDAGYSVHVFLHLRQEQHLSSRNPAMDNLTRLLQPVSITYHSRRDSCHLTRCAKSEARCPFALLHAQQCYDHIVAHEHRTGTNFQWVYKTQLDVALGANITTPHNFAVDTVYTNQHDPNSTIIADASLRSMFPDYADLLFGPVSSYLIAASHKTADTVFNAIEAFRECAFFDLPFDVASAEIGLLYWLVSRGVRYKTMPWFWIFTNSVSGPDCNRVRWIRDEHGVHDPSLTEICLSYSNSNILQTPETSGFQNRK